MKKTETPENNPHYPESIRHSEALRAFYDNCGENRSLALAIDKAVRDSKQDGFRNNMHLYVKPPNGNVVVSAPLKMSNEAIERFVRTKTGWIKKQINKFDEQPRQAEREYVYGETLYVWGKQYYLQKDSRMP